MENNEVVNGKQPAASILAYIVGNIAVICLQVFKNRKMPGRMGGVQRTVKNVWVYQIDPARNLLYLKGQVVSSVPLNLTVCLADV